jgi:hypothetical protein
LSDERTERTNEHSHTYMHCTHTHTHPHPHTNTHTHAHPHHITPTQARVSHTSKRALHTLLTHFRSCSMYPSTPDTAAAQLAGLQPHLCISKQKTRTQQRRETRLLAAGVQSVDILRIRADRSSETPQENRCGREAIRSPHPPERVRRRPRSRAGERPRGCAPCRWRAESWYRRPES